MKPYLLLKKRHMACVLTGLFLAAVLLVSLTMALPDLLAGVSANARRRLPIYCTDRADKVVSLTFDAAWGDEDTGQLIDILGKHNVRVTFFATGDWVDRCPESVKALHDAGHEIMNHSDTHPHMPDLTREKMLRELRTCNDKIQAITGVCPTLHRAPYGDYDNALIETVESAGMQCVQWDVDSLDWRELPVEEIVKRVTGQVSSGSIVLFHNGVKNTPEALDTIIEQLLAAERVIAKDFETRELFQACQPIEEIARAGRDAPRFGTLKPVGLTDPRTGRRPWAALQLRAEDAHGASYNLVGFQTNLTFPEQRRVFRMIPGLEEAEFARYGVMHRNTFIDAPRLLDRRNRLVTPQADVLGVPVYVAGQLAGTEGYCEAIRSGLHVALAVTADLAGIALPELPTETVFGALLAYATDPATKDYQPMHVNFGLMAPLSPPVRNKRARYQAYADRANEALAGYKEALAEAGLLP